MQIRYDALNKIYTSRAHAHSSRPPVHTHREDRSVEKIKQTVRR
ncbi:hypothetical protein HMPREF3192_01365 [Atopobium deltae]|uniref:Uncharacterized protein n=1 Tax=Atopobium deltae TaxID=1393034 RepID=A0A133XPY0_9ACTN|nr:hypothetical protein HMPREF3192_01365 [Atopobium deltae]